MVEAVYSPKGNNMEQEHYKIIATDGPNLSFDAGETHYSFQQVSLPPAFMDWVIDGRKAMYDLLEGKGSAPFFSSHLPVAVTYSRNASFPFNTGNKGVGLLPVADRIEDYCRLYLDTIRDCRGIPWEESLPKRVGAVRSFINGGDISNQALISLEIFEKTTFANLSDFPLATLHYTGDGPVYRSFQINTVVQILPPEHPVYRFAYLSRNLFEFDNFHITQTKFPYAYLFYPVEVRDKTPFPRRDEESPPAPATQWDEMTLLWDEPVLAQLARAPSFVQKFIVKVTEEYARKEGRNRVDLEMFNAIRAKYERRK